jgi:hypothetical protein
MVSTVRRVRLSALIGVLCLALAGTAIAQITEQDYADRVDSICKKGASSAKRKLNKLRPSGDPGFDAFRAARLFRNEFARTVKRIGNVEKPDAKRQDAKSFVQGLRREKRLYDRAVTAFRKADAALLGKVGKKLGKARKQNARAATELGLKNCGAISA